MIASCHTVSIYEGSKLLFLECDLLNLRELYRVGLMFLEAGSWIAR
jgi:hypothetical protein